jgi:hypothetical protein
MPLVYGMGWFAARDHHAASSWIWVELLGLALFAAFAALGLKNSPWFLAVGIVAHELAWDTWHYRNSTYIPDWYATACLAVDLAFGAYVAARVPAYQSASRNKMSWSPGGGLNVQPNRTIRTRPTLRPLDAKRVSSVIATRRPDRIFAGSARRQFHRRRTYRANSK